MSIWESVTAPTPALPLDVFRVLVGALSLAYFARTYREAPLFSAPDGLIDHALQRRMFPFTRLSLFPSRSSLAWLRAMYAVGCVVSVLLIVGIGARPAALFLYLLAVSTYRWNFIVMYVDDAIMHLALFWMVVLPIGHTLTLPELLATPSESWAAWQASTVPGLGVYCLLANLALVYLVAGLWKWSSPMWRHGSALHAVLRMPCSYTPAVWRPALGTLLRIGNYCAMVIEPLLALLLIVPPHAPLKWALLGAAFAFHGGIIATMKFPFANLAMLGGTVVFFGPELMGALGANPGRRQPLPPGPADWLALATVTTLALLFLLNACWFRSGATTSLGNDRAARTRGVNPLYVPLWIIGLAQSYRLFDWIDERNYQVEYEVLEERDDRSSRRIEPAIFFPCTLRHVLLQSYLYGNLWIKVDPAVLPELRTSILRAYARRYCAAVPAAGAVAVHATVRRLTADNLDLHRGTRTLLLRFANRDGDARVTEMCLAPPAYA